MLVWHGPEVFADIFFLLIFFLNLVLGSVSRKQVMLMKFIHLFGEIFLKLAMLHYMQKMRQDWERLLIVSRSIFRDILTYRIRSIFRDILNYVKCELMSFCEY